MPIVEIRWPPMCMKCVLGCYYVKASIETISFNPHNNHMGRYCVPILQTKKLKMKVTDPVISDGRIQIQVL